jgi:hypothetical protein
MWLLKNAKKELNIGIKYKKVLGYSACTVMVLSLIFLLIILYLIFNKIYKNGRAK